MAEVDIFCQGSGKDLELTPALLPVGANESWQVLLPAIQDDGGGGGRNLASRAAALGELAGDVEASACRVEGHEGIYEGEEDILVDRVNGFPPEPHVPIPSGDGELFVSCDHIGASACGKCESQLLDGEVVPGGMRAGGRETKPDETCPADDDVRPGTMSPPSVRTTVSIAKSLGWLWIVLMRRVRRRVDTESSGQKKTSKIHWARAGRRR